MDSIANIDQNNLNSLIISYDNREILYANIVDNKLKDLNVVRPNQKIGNIYVGVISNIVDKIGSCFVDIDGCRGFAKISDFKNQINPITKEKYKVEKGEKILVQMQQENTSSKAPRVTSNINISGRFFIFAPFQKKIRISKKATKSQYLRMSKFLSNQSLPGEFGLVCRTVSLTADKKALLKDMEMVKSIWENICNQFKEAKSSKLIYDNKISTIFHILQLANNSSKNIIVDSKDFKEKIEEKCKFYDINDINISLYSDKSINILDKYRIYGEIEKCLSKKVWLPSGGHIIIDHTEAMTTIDVNSGKDTQSEAQSLESSILGINLEAATIIPEQLHLRGIGGIVIIDFIDVENHASQNMIFKQLKSSMNAFQNKYSISKMSKIGLIEMTRQRTQSSLYQLMTTSCPYCEGSGRVKNLETISLYLIKKCGSLFSKYNSLSINLHPNLYEFLIDESFIFIIENISKLNKSKIKFIENDNLHINEVIFSHNGINIESIS